MNHHLAQVNIAKLCEPIGSPLLADLVAKLDKINALAEKKTRFVWQLKNETYNTAANNIFDDEDGYYQYVGLENSKKPKNYVYKTANQMVRKTQN